MQLVPAPVKIHAELMSFCRNDRSRGGEYFEAVLHPGDKLGGTLTVEILDSPVIGHDVELIFREYDRQERVVLLETGVSGVFVTPQFTYPPGSGAPMMAVGHVQFRDGGKQDDQTVDQGLIGNDPGGVSDAVARDEIIFRRAVGNPFDDSFRLCTGAGE